MVCSEVFSIQFVFLRALVQIERTRAGSHKVFARPSTNIQHELTAEEKTAHKFRQYFSGEMFMFMVRFAKA